MKQPLLALLAARALTAAAALWAGVNPLDPNAYVRWDSNHYLGIAQRGYFLEHCGPGSGYDPSQWCGNAGWFPLYPWLLKIAPGALISLVFEAILLVLIWRRAKSFPVLLLAALFPGCIFQQAVYPISLFLVCVLLFLEFWRPETGAIAAMAYPTGFLLVPVAVLKRRWLAAIGVVLGFLAVIAVMRVQTGHWDAYLLTQRKYEFHFAPFDTFFSRLKPLVNARYRDAASFAAGLQTLLVLAMMVLGVRSWREKPEIAAYCVFYWAFPLCLGYARSLYRAESLLVPLVLLMPGRARVPLLVIAAPIAFAMSVAFFRGSLV